MKSKIELDSEHYGVGLYDSNRCLVYVFISILERGFHLAGELPSLDVRIVFANDLFRVVECASGSCMARRSHERLSSSPTSSGGIK